MKKIIIASLVVIVAVIAVVILVGFYEGKLPFTEEYNDRQLVKQWFQMYDGESDEDDIDEVMETFKNLDIHPVEIYRGSMIFYESSYGYMYIPDFDEDFKGYPPGITTDEEYLDLINEFGGTITEIYLDPNFKVWCVCFPTLKEAEQFLAELWSFK